MKSSTNQPLFESLELRQLLSAGQLDTSFGSGGSVVVNQGLFGATGVSVESDGKILVNAIRDAQYDSRTISGTSTVAKFNADGSLDTSFGNGGISGVSIGKSGPITVGVNESDMDEMGTIATLADGKFLLLGSKQMTAAGGHQTVSRYNADGSLDTTFGNQGRTVLTFTPMGVTSGMVSGGACQLVVLGDGKILVTRSNGFGPGADLQIVRLNADGGVDTTFGVNGIATVADAGDPEGLVIQSDGKLVVATTGHVNEFDARANQNMDHMVATHVIRLNANGTVDSSFGDGGIVSEHAAAGDRMYARQVLITADGKIVLTGQETLASDQGVNRAFIIRYNADGSRDTSFGTGGEQLLDGETDTILIDGEGRIVTLGTHPVDGNKRLTLFSQRVETDGALDTGYGVNGIVALDAPGKSYHAFNLALTAEGDVIIAGTISDPEVFSSNPPDSHPDLVLIKLQGGDDAGSGLQSSISTSSKKPRSPKRIAMELAAQQAASEQQWVLANQSHRSPKRVAMEQAALAAASQRSPKRIAMELAANESHRSPKRIAMEQAALTALTFSKTKIS